MCALQCEEGFNGSGDPSHVCDVEGTSVKWRSVGGNFDCVSIGKCNPALQSLSSSLHIASSDGGGSDGIVYAVIGAAAGGSAVSVVLTLLCTTALYLRWSYKNKKAKSFSNEPHHECIQDSQSVPHQKTVSTIKVDYKPSYGIVDNDSNAVKMDSNLLYEIIDLDVTDDDDDLSYDTGKLKRKITEAPLSLHGENTIKTKTISSHKSIVRDNNTSFNPLHDATSHDYDYVELDKINYKDNTSKMEIDPIYQSTAGHSRAVEIYDVTNIESEISEDCVVEVDDTNHHGDDTVEMEIDPVYQTAAEAQDCKVVRICDVTKEIDEDLCNYMEPDEDHRKNTSKMEIDPIYQSTAGHSTTVEIYDVANIERKTSEDHDDEVSHHKEDTTEVETDPAYQSVVYKK